MDKHPEEAKTKMIIGKYEVIERLGRGGMGVVYKARDTRTGHVVALKVVQESSDFQEEISQRFNRESSMLARLRHPNIVRVYDAGFSENIQYVAREFVEGKSLAQHLKDDKPAINRKVEILRDIAFATYSAHREGIIHRDIKPANVIIQSDGVAKLTDFDLSKDIRKKQTFVTESGIALGTPGYMSPEQASGKRSAVDTRSDIYSLGAVLYEMLTGRPPFVGESTAEVLARLLIEDPPRPRDLDMSIPPELEAICLKAVQKDKTSRYRSAKLLAQDLDRYLKGGRVTVRPETGTMKVISKLSGHKLWIIAGAAVVLGTVLLAAALMRESKARRLAEFNRLVEEGDHCCERQRYEDATEAFKSAREIFPDRAEPHLGLACAKALERSLEYGFSEAAKARKLDDSLGNRCRSEGLENIRKDASRAAILFTKAILYAPEDAELFKLRGQAFAAAGQPIPAIGDFTVALAKLPEDLDIFADMGRCHIFLHRSSAIYNPEQAKKELESGFADLDRAAELAVRQDRKGIAVAILREKATFQADSRIYSGAVADMTRAIGLSPGEPTLYYERGRFQESEGSDLNSAKADYLKALEIVPDYIYAEERLARVYGKLGEFDKAWERVRKCLDSGIKFDTEFMDDLKKRSGRTE
jgi:tetratricopeptide (TPR) repeat protein